MRSRFVVDSGHNPSGTVSVTTMSSERRYSEVSICSDQVEIRPTAIVGWSTDLSTRRSSAVRVIESLDVTGRAPDP